MNLQTLVSYIKSPDKLGDQTIIELTLLADQYPYFHTAQLLRVKNLHKLDPAHLKPVLNYTAAYVTDRKVLYYLLHPNMGTDQKLTPKSPEKQIKDSMVENISDTLTNQVRYTNETSSDEIEFSASFDVIKEYGKDVELKEYVFRISDHEAETMGFIPESAPAEPSMGVAKEEPLPGSDDLLLLIKKGEADNIQLEIEKLSPTQKNQHSLIESFMASNPKIVPQNGQIEAVDPEIAEASIRENDHYLTETLAQIYLRQGNYVKAIFAYEKLSLKFPEKSTYFAAQISAIKLKMNKS
ncbi:MAG: hypothetical protein IPM71_09105 [Bacteroidota bacterium]|nr:MAG: hypothetical protein IPM71_09105 [Bacteroidota bacterium]